MELLETLMIGPMLYVVLLVFVKTWNSEVDKEYNRAQLIASILLGQGQKVEASQIMDRALSEYKRLRIRKVLGYKVK